MLNAVGGKARRGTRAALAGLIRGVTSRRVMRSGAARHAWHAALSVPGIPDRRRVALAKRVQASMTRAGHPSSAAAATDSATRRLRDSRAKLELLGPLTDAELADGRIPRHLETVAAAELANADALYLAGRVGQAITSLNRAMNLLFHRVLHYDNLSSPLADDPESFLRPFHRSAVGQRIAAPRGRREPAAPPPGDRPLRLLFFTGVNDNFLGEIRDRYENHPGVEVRCLDFTDGPLRELLNNSRRRLLLHGMNRESEYGDHAADLLRPHLDWADTVFVDWCVSAAGVLSMVDPGTTRIVHRLHSFEAFSVWPHLVDFSRVDDIVFVSEHLRDLGVAVVPRLAGPDAPRTHVISNAMDLRRFPAEKSTQARFNLGLVGISAVAKDPRWAVEVLRALRRHDDRYRLLLVGSDINPEQGPGIRRYRDAFEADLADLEPEGIVRRLGQTSDVPAALTDVGVILSTSARESFHCALVEGAASGAVPVVRNWPFFAGKARGAHTLFPVDWVVDTPEQAATRILAVTSDEEVWRKAGRAASAYVLETWDWTVVRQDFDRLFLGPIDREDHATP
ncbi:glycosyltransferase family 1 protein [Micromonosporaceae bacterium B7E4]